jgi:hypothetical protein
MRKSSSGAQAKVFYRPIEAAIRWSGLLRFEQRILATLKQRPLPEVTEFPRWPMLRLNAERIFDALAHGEMPYGKDGLGRDTLGLAMDDSSLTVRHVDLKAWMAHYYPGEKPAFLFDEIERALHPAISLDTVGTLLVEREAIKARLAEHLSVYESLRAEHEALLKTHAACAADAERANAPGPRSETTYLNIIGGLLTLLLGKSPSGMPYSSFLTQEAIISAMVAHHSNAMGITERTLQAKFALARRRLQSTNS